MIWGSAGAGTAGSGLDGVDDESFWGWEGVVALNKSFWDWEGVVALNKDGDW